MVNINYLSDLHLEVSNMKLDKLDGDVVILAGDISADIELLLSFVERNLLDKEVIYVLGNHEYECKNFNTNVDEYKKALRDFKNIHILENEAIDLFGVRFIGATLWSNFEGGGVVWKNESMNLCEKSINDFSTIFINEGKKRYIRANDIIKKFDESYRFLSYELKKRNTVLPKVVISHFAPSVGSLSENRKDDLISSYWVNSINELVELADFWIHGHVHETFSYSVGEAKILCNPRGVSKIYDLSSNVLFEKNKIFAIENVVKCDKKHKI